MTQFISTSGGLGAYSVLVNGKHVGHVSTAKDGKFVAIVSGKVLGRFDSKVEAVDKVAGL